MRVSDHNEIDFEKPKRKCEVGVWRIVVGVLEVSERPDEVKRPVIVASERPQIKPVLVRPTRDRRASRRGDHSCKHHSFHSISPFCF